MLRICGYPCVRLPKSSCIYGAGRRVAYLGLRSQDTEEASVATRSSKLRLGVLGLGAIGTIFFTRLGLLAATSKANRQLPTLTVDAFIKTERFDDWRANSKLQLTSEGKKQETLEFLVNPKEKVATVSNAPNVRVRTLDSGDRLDILLVAVKAYDSVGVIRELRERNRHLLKDDALCVLLQNGLGEVPEEQKQSEVSGVDGGWQFANGVTFVGGRMVEFGNVATSGLDEGMTYLAPLGGFRDDKVKEGEQLRRRETMAMLAQVLSAAGLCCEVLEAREMQAMLWRKLIVNAAINPLASLLDAPNGSVAGCRECVALVVKEALAVARSEQIPLACSEDELVEDILNVVRNTSTNVCSMLADLRRGSRTEISAITGRIVAGGKRHGIPTPTNNLLLSLVKSLEKEGSRRKE